MDAKFHLSSLHNFDINEKDNIRIIDEYDDFNSAEEDTDADDKSDEYKQKIKDIEEAIRIQDITKLKELTISEGGLLSDSLRCLVWPLLADVTHLPTSLPSTEFHEKHTSYRQVILDVERTIGRFPPGITPEKQPELKTRLTRLIMSILCQNCNLHYYQGFHDIAVTFLLVLDSDEKAFAVLHMVSQTYLAEFMRPTLERTTYLLYFIYPIIRRVKPELYSLLMASDVGTIFALPWLITWFSHVISDYSKVVRLFDFFLSHSTSLAPVYLAAALVLHRQTCLYKMSPFLDMASIHDLLSKTTKLPDLPLEALLRQSLTLYEHYPPSSLESEVEVLIREEEQKRLLSLSKRSRTLTKWPNLLRKLVIVTVPVIVGILIGRYYYNSQ